MISSRLIEDLIEDLSLGLGLDWLLSQHTLDRRGGNAMPPGDLADALPLAAVALDGGTVKYQRLAADLLTFETGAPHTGAHPLDDQAAFEFRDGADDHNDGPTQRTGGVDVLSERDVFDVDPVEFIQNIEEVLRRPGDPIGCPNQDDVESARALGKAHLV